MHAHCPTPNIPYVIKTLFVDDVTQQVEKFQNAHSNNNYQYYRDKGYSSNWNAWRRYATDSDIGGYKIAPMDTYFPLAESDNSLLLLQKMPEKSLGFFVLTGVNSRMGLTGLAGAATYVFFREIGTQGSILAITKAGIKTRIWENGTLVDWV